jgi:hypothetical protein
MGTLDQQNVGARNVAIRLLPQTPEMAPVTVLLRQNAPPAVLVQQNRRVLLVRLTVLTDHGHLTVLLAINGSLPLNHLDGRNRHRTVPGANVRMKSSERARIVLEYDLTVAINR